MAPGLGWILARLDPPQSFFHSTGANIPSHPPIASPSTPSSVSINFFSTTSLSTSSGATASSSTPSTSSPISSSWPTSLPSTDAAFSLVSSSAASIPSLSPPPVSAPPPSSLPSISASPSPSISASPRLPSILASPPLPSISAPRPSPSPTPAARPNMRAHARDGSTPRNSHNDLTSAPAWPWSSKRGVPPICSYPTDPESEPFVECIALGRNCSGVGGSEAT
ncbi:hypothetical protein BC936DRAFT_144603 [Jimgerdemannia flammicorona]|uniref:Uncharacterized protein n=2 Tax=Jimgerdemannia flammicorona TaxID=994334 RepID=A0A433Q7L6_9FUNG|nr:hypothetical protein BC936DRAFT_144603 [Jimgerdemannia flammicorona]RUS25765.1 hypothetical protein BC938DRAFT_471687 [Jimgerdemannia flammicorona]